MPTTYNGHRKRSKSTKESSDNKEYKSILISHYMPMCYFRSSIFNRKQDKYVFNVRKPPHCCHPLKNNNSATDLLNIELEPRTSLLNILWTVYHFGSEITTSTRPMVEFVKYARWMGGSWSWTPIAWAGTGHAVFINHNVNPRRRIKNGCRGS